MSNLEQFVRKGLINRGVYSPTETYYIDNVVSHNNKYSVCLENNVKGIDPTNTQYWDTISSAAELSVQTIGTGTNPATFTLTNVNGVITLNKVA